MFSHCVVFTSSEKKIGKLEKKNIYMEEEVEEETGEEDEEEVEDEEDEEEDEEDQRKTRFDV